MEFQRTLGPIQGIAMTVSTFVGTGLMLLPALSVNQSHHFALYAWLITVVLILPVAFVFALLGGRFPSAGGASHYIGKAFGKSAEKALGWLFLSILLVGPAVAIKIAGAYLAAALNVSDHYVFPLSVIIVIATALYSLAGIKNSARFQFIIVLALISAVALLTWQGDPWGEFAQTQLPRSTNEWNTAFLSIGTIFWCFIGIEVMAHMGAEFRNPNRDFPIALLGGVTIVVGLYLLLVLLISKYHTYGDDITNSQSVALLVGLLFGEASQRAFAAGAFIIAFTNTGMYQLGFARMIHSLSQNGALPSIFGRLSQNGSPSNAIYLTSAVTLSSITFGHFSGWSLNWFIEMTNGAFLLIYTLTCIAALKLLLGQQKWLALLATLSSFILIGFVGLNMWFAITIFLVAILFEYHKDRKNLMSRHKIHVQ